MRVKLTLGLVDRPGVLLKVLEQVALYGGNIISIIHSRDRITGGYVPVSMNIEFPDDVNLERAKAGIEALGVPVMEAETLEKKIETVIMLGRVNVEEIMRFLSARGVKIVGLTLHGQPVRPCLKLILELPVESRMEIMSDLDRLAETEGSIVIREAEI